MNFRTDLALEAAENLADASPEDFDQTRTENGDTVVTKINVKTARGAELIGKPPGIYVTAEIPPLSDNDEALEQEAYVIAGELSAMLPRKGTVLVVGIGNSSITPDALGPMAAGMVLATRHIDKEFARSTGLDNLRPVAVSVPGVLGQTGIETSETVKGLCGMMKPSVVIAVDALASRSLSRLGCTVQLCDSGISPGSGIGNNRQALNKDTLGIPVVGLGVPTVVDAEVIARELTGSTEEFSPRGASMMVTPREIDLVIRRASKLAAMAINAALQPAYSPLELIAVAM